MTIQIPIKSSHLKIPHPLVKSTIDRNLKANANSKSPKFTLTFSNHPPDFGKLDNHCGNKANKVNGKANAMENPNIPIIGFTLRTPIEGPTSVAACTNNDPIIGPVQEKETNAKVNAMKNIPATPPLSESWSVLFAHEAGSVISNNPKNDSAKITKMMKKRILKNALVLMTFKASAPNIKVTDKPRAR